jgi:hypothetical protein
MKQIPVEFSLVSFSLWNTNDPFQEIKLETFTHSFTHSLIFFLYFVIDVEEEKKGLVSTTNPDEIFNQLKEQLKGTPVFKPFTEMLQKLLLVRRGGKQGYLLHFPYRCLISNECQNKYVTLILSSFID